MAAQIPQNLTPEQQARAHAAAAKEFMLPGVQSEMKIEINEFTRKTKRLTDLFNEIETDLMRIDSKGLNLVSGSNERLAPAWTQHKLTFRKLLWDSRDLATEIATIAEQFTTIILPLATSVKTNGRLSQENLHYLNEVIASIDFFISQNQSSSEKAKKQADDFTNLKDQITRFKDKFNGFGKQLEAENNAAIDSLTKQIAGVEKALESVNKVATVSAVALGLSVLGAVAIFKFMPNVSWKILAAAAGTVVGSGGALAASRSQANNLRKEKEEAQVRMAQLASLNNDIAKARQELKEISDNKISEVITGLDLFVIVWSSVNADCGAIKGYLEKIKNGSKPGAVPSLMLIPYAQGATTIYTGLRRALKDYAIGIVDSGATPP